ncbi:MAG: hypothetical protein ACLVEU_08610 [Bacteroides cellulosilyticus]
MFDITSDSRFWAIHWTSGRVLSWSNLPPADFEEMDGYEWNRRCHYTHHMARSASN